MCHHSNLIPQRCVPPFSVTIPSIRTQTTISPSTTPWLNTSTFWSPVFNKWTHVLSSPPMRWKKRTGKHSPMKCVLLVFLFSMYVIFPPFINRISPSTILFIVLCMSIKTCQRTSVCSNLLVVDVVDNNRSVVNMIYNHMIEEFQQNNQSLPV